MLRSLLLALTLLLALGCKPPLKKMNLLVIGDSNAVGQGWAYELQQLRGNGPMVNTAVSGNTIGFERDGMERNTLENLTTYLRRGYAEMGDIDAIVIGLGTNDCKAKYADQENERLSKLTELLDRTRSFFLDRGQELPLLVLLTPPPAGDDTVVIEEFQGARECTQRLSDFIRTTGDAIDVCVVDLQREPGDAVLEDSRDGIHFGPIGYRAIAREVVKCLR